MKPSIINQVAIFGGNGNFGKFMGQLISKTGIKVVNILQETTTQEKEDIIKNSDVIIFSVPINSVVESIKSNSSIILGNKLVLDVTGIKTPAMEELKKLNVSEIVGTHPMFGPFGENLKGKKIIFSPEKAGKKWTFIRRVLKKSQAILTELTPEEHDKKMAIIQALTHIVNMIFIKTIQDLGVHPSELELLETPIYKLQALISGRFLNQSGALYADMQIENQVFLEDVLPVLIKNLTDLSQIDLTGDKKGFTQLFDDLSNFLGTDFKDKSMEKTKKI